MKLNTKNLAGVEIGIPVVAAGTYHARITKAEVKPNKQGDANNLVIMVKLLDPVAFSHKDGAEIKNNGQLVCTRYISLKETPNYDPDKAVKELAVAIGHPPEMDLELEHLTDKLVMVKLGINEKTDKYPESNSLDRFTKVPADDTFTAPPL